jgi:uncharacterized protein (TIGR03118 family)
MLRTVRGLQRWVRGGPLRPRRRQQRPMVEDLEPRALLSVTPVLHEERLAALRAARVGASARSVYVANHTARPHGPHVRLSMTYTQTNLVSDFPVGVEGVNPQLSDPSLVNPWGMAFSSTGPFWISDQITGVSTLYSVQNGTVTKVPLTVTIPPPSGGGKLPLTGPTGIVFNNTTSFTITNASGTAPASFIFATLDGTIAAWNRGSGTTAQIMTQVPGEEFTGLTMGQVGSTSYLYTADPRGYIDVFNGSFQKVTLTGSFVDPELPAGFSPYNIQNLGGNLYVAYTTPASGGGYIAEFDTSGNFIRQVAGNGSGGPLQAPWGMTLAPSNFGCFSNDLLVGNFGDGRISAFNPTTGRFLGQLTDSSGNPITIPFLWALSFGNGQAAGSTNVLYFTAGIAGQFHGLFGAITANQPVLPVRPVHHR